MKHSGENLAAMLFLFTACAAQAAGTRVEIIVNPTLYASGQITTSINAYMRDITYQGYTPVLTTTAFSGPAALRSHLAAEYNSSAGLAGAVFVGDLPVATYGVGTRADIGFPAENFPCDLFYENLSGTWGDANSDGIYDSLSGTVAPQIWVGRIAVSSLTSLQPGRTEAGMINAYFARNHAYRTRQVSLSTNGLAYIDDDWSIYGWQYSMQPGVSGSVVAFTNGATTTAADFKARLQTSFEQVFLAAHSTATYSLFKVGSDWSGGTLDSRDLAGVNPQAFTYNLFACSAGNFQQSGYLAGELAFGAGKGLLAVASTKTGGMLDHTMYYQPLGQGQTYGQAWQNWWNYQSNGGYSGDETMWDFGMVLLGDPLLTTQAFRPVPKADVNGDGTVNGADIDAVRAHLGGVDPAYDLNNDGVVNRADVDAIVKTLIHTNYGDVNLDGLVDFLDFQSLLDHWMSSGDWADGDITGDGAVDFLDFQAMLDNWNPTGASTGVVPEPGAAALLMGAITMLARRSRRGLRTQSSPGFCGTASLCENLGLDKRRTFAHNNRSCDLK